MELKAHSNSGQRADKIEKLKLLVLPVFCFKALQHSIQQASAKKVEIKREWGSPTVPFLSSREEVL